MKVTRKQLFDIVRNALNEVNYYTKKFTLANEEAAKKFEADFDDNSTVPWSSLYDEEEKSITLSSKMEFEVKVKIFEPKSQKFSVEAFDGNSERSFIRKSDLDPLQLKEFISNIDDIVIEVVSENIRKGKR